MSRRWFSPVSIRVNFFADEISKAMNNEENGIKMLKNIITLPNVTHTLKCAALFGGMVLAICANSSFAAPDSTIEVYGGWNLQCKNDTSSGVDTPTECNLTQGLSDSSSGQRVLSFSFVVDASETAAKPNQKSQLTLMTPLAIDLGAGIDIQLGAESVENFGFETCLPAGCFVKMEISRADFEQLALVDAMTVSFTPAGSNDAINLSIPTNRLVEAGNRLLDLAYK